MNSQRSDFSEYFLLTDLQLPGPALAPATIGSATAQVDPAHQTLVMTPLLDVVASLTPRDNGMFGLIKQYPQPCIAATLLFAVLLLTVAAWSLHTAVRKRTNRQNQ